MFPQDTREVVVFGAGVIGLTTSLVLSHAYTSAKITVVAKHFPGDRSIEYASPWAGANWSSMAHDNGPLESYDRTTFHRFSQLIDGKSVFGCTALKAGEGNDVGLGRMGMWAIFDAPIEETGILTEETGKVWYDSLVGGLRELSKQEMQGRGKDAVFGVEFPTTYRINTQVYLQWLQAQALAKGVTLVRRQYLSVKDVLSDHPSTSLLVNCTGLGSLALSDIKDIDMYPTRGQTLLVAEPQEPINRMYEADRKYLRSPARINPTTTYIFPRPLGGGIILGGSRDDNNWSEEWDEQLGQEIMKRCCELCPELGTLEEVEKRVIGRNVGLRPSRKGGPRIETEKGKWSVPVVHCYGHAGAGYQSSWGTAERVLELVQKTLEPSSKL